MFVTWYRCCDVCKSPAYTVIAFACSSIFRAFFNARCYILWIIRFHDALLNDLWLWAGLLHNYFACFPLILEPACFQEKWNSNYVLFFMNWVSWLMIWGKLNTHITCTLVFQSLFSSLVVKLYDVFYVIWVSQIMTLSMLAMHCLTTHCLRSPCNLLNFKGCNTWIIFCYMIWMFNL